MFDEFRDDCDFLSVYIAEAHAQDKWPVSSGRYNGGRGPVCVEEARSNEDRCVMAAAFARNYGFTVPTLADPVVLASGAPGETFERLMAPWPIRFCACYVNGLLQRLLGVVTCDV